MQSYNLFEAFLTYTLPAWVERVCCSTACLLYKHRPDSGYFTDSNGDSLVYCLRCGKQLT